MPNDELPYADNFIVSENWVKSAIRKAMIKKSRDYYLVTNVDRLSDGKYLIRIEKDWNTNAK